MLEFATPRDGAASRCDLILDLTGGAPLFQAHAKRDGYLRPDPADPIAVQKALLEAAGLVGVFDKPRYVGVAPGLCAHSRNGRTGLLAMSRRLPDRGDFSRRRHRRGRSAYLRRLRELCRQFARPRRCAGPRRTRRPPSTACAHC